MIYYTIHSPSPAFARNWQKYEAQTLEKAETELFCFLLEQGHEPTNLVKSQVNLTSTKYSLPSTKDDPSYFFTIIKKFK
jgi:hypothetical protein